jgi:L-rhamnose mutarotase
MKRYCLALDLIDDPIRIAEYEEIHKAVRPEILLSIEKSGILSMEIFRTGNRMFMLMETNVDFSFADKAAADASDPKVQEWEELMWTYQQALPGAKPGEKWVLLDSIFSFRS